MNNKGVFVLVHGMFYGGWCWDKLAPLLRNASHDIHAPTLAGLAERADMCNQAIDLNTHAQKIVDLIELQNLRGVILVGHSLGGFMAPIVADRIPERIAHIVNLDGMVPENSDEWWYPPILEWTHSKLTPHPLKTLTTPAALENTRAKSIPSTFIRCSDGMTDEDVAAEEKKFTGFGMNFRSLPTGHDAMITIPEELAKTILELSGNNQYQI